MEWWNRKVKKWKINCIQYCYCCKKKKVDYVHHNYTFYDKIANGSFHKSINLIFHFNVNVCNLLLFFHCIIVVILLSRTCIFILLMMLFNKSQSNVLCFFFYCCSYFLYPVKGNYAYPEFINIFCQVFQSFTTYMWIFYQVLVNCGAWHLLMVKMIFGY